MKKSLILGLTLLTLVGARANPTDPQTAAGRVTVQSSGSQMDIVQHTRQAILNWGSFSIAPNELVRILQSGPQATLLNRVTGQAPSYLLGSLSATGRVFLLNPNGVFIGPGARIEAGSFLASTLAMSDADFLAGNYHLVQDASKAQGAVVNQGEISVSEGGFVMLAAPLVSNEGLILAQSGQIALAAGTETTLSFDPQGLMHFTMPATETAPGPVLVPREQVSELLGQLVGNPNLVEAGAIREEDGRVWLDGSSGVLLQSGRMSAERVLMSSTQATVVPGTVTGQEIRLLSQGNSVLSPSGELRAPEGFVEVSGRNFWLQGTTEADHLLLDPITIEIVDGAGGSLDPNLPDVLLNDDIPPNTVSELALEGVTAGTVLLEAEQFIVRDIADNQIALQPGVSLDMQGFGNSSVTFLDTNDQITTSGGGGFDWRFSGFSVVGNLLAPGGFIHVTSAGGLQLEPLNGGIVADQVVLSGGFGPIQTGGNELPGTIAVTATNLTLGARDLQIATPTDFYVDVANLELTTENGSFLVNVRTPVPGNSSLYLERQPFATSNSDIVFWGPTGFLIFAANGELTANLPGTSLVLTAPVDILANGVSADSVQLNSLTGQILDANPGAGPDVSATAPDGFLELISPVRVGRLADPLEILGDTVIIHTFEGSFAEIRVDLATAPSQLSVQTSGDVTITGAADLSLTGALLSGDAPGSLSVTAPALTLGLVTAPNEVALSAPAILDGNGTQLNVQAGTAILLVEDQLTADVAADLLIVRGEAATVNLNQGQGGAQEIGILNPGGTTLVRQDGTLYPSLELNVESANLGVDVQNGSLTSVRLLTTGPVDLQVSGDATLGDVTSLNRSPVTVTAGGSIRDNNGDERNFTGTPALSLTAGGDIGSATDPIDLGGVSGLTLQAQNAYLTDPLQDTLGLDDVQVDGTLSFTSSLTALILGQVQAHEANLTAVGIFDDQVADTRLVAHSATLVTGIQGVGGLTRIQASLDELRTETTGSSIILDNDRDLRLISATSTGPDALTVIDIGASGDLTVGRVQMLGGENQFVQLVAGGDIRDGNGDALNVQSPFAFLDAEGDIGSASDPIDLEVFDFGQAISENGSVYLADPTDIRLGAAAAHDVVVTAGGDLLLQTVIAPDSATLVAGGNILDGNDGEGPLTNLFTNRGRLQAGGVVGEANNPLEVSLEDGGLLTIDPRGSIDGVAGSINLVRGGNIDILPDVAGAVLLNGSDLFDPLPPSATGFTALPGEFGEDLLFRAGLLSDSILAQNNNKLANTNEGPLYTYDVIFIVTDQSWLDVVRGSVVWEDE